MTPLTVERPREQATQPGTGLWHICRAHPFQTCCTVACVALCGFKHDREPTIRVAPEPSPDDCVVCEAMFAAKYGGTT